MENNTLNLNEEELINFFEKYNTQELETFKTIFEYVYDYDITNEITILNEIYENRFKDYCVPVEETNYQTTNLVKKNGQLTDKEVEFLYLLTDDARLCLSSINHYDVEELYKAIDDIAEVAYEEMDIRKRIKGKTLKLNLKTKKEA